VSTTRSGWPSVMRPRHSSLRKAGLKRSVSTARCHTSIRFARHPLRRRMPCSMRQQNSQLHDGIALKEMSAP